MYTVFLNNFYLKKRLRSKFFQNIATMLMGNVTAQAVALLAAPVITRLYTPDDFGIMCFIQASAGIFIVIACLRYRNAIVLPEDDKKAQSLLCLSLIGAAFTSGILLVIIIIYKGEIAGVCNIKRYENFLFFLPFIVFIGSGREILVFFHTRFKNFKLIPLTTVLMPIANSVTKIGAGVFISTSAFWLVFGNIIGPLLSATVLLLFLAQIIPDIKKNIDFKSIRRAAIEYSDFPKYNIPTALIHSLNQNIPVLFFSLFFSNKILGFYGLANIILRKPVTVMSESVSKVFVQRTAEVKNQGGDIYSLLRKTTFGLFLTGILPFGLLAVIGESLFSFVFGKEWSVAGGYAQILSPYLFFLFINKAANQVYLVKEKLKSLFSFRVLQLVLTSLCFVVGGVIYKSPDICLYGYMLSGVFINIFFVQTAFKLSKRP